MNKWIGGLALATSLALSGGLAYGTGETDDAVAQKPKPVLKQVAATETPVEKTFGAWIVTCPKEDKSKLKCAARFTVSDTKRNVVIMNWVLGYNAAGKMLMEILSPSDVYIEPGVVVMIGGKEAAKLPYVTCGTAGCLSRVTMNKAMLASLKGTAEATVILAATTGKNIEFKMGIPGVSDALKALGQ